MARKQPKTITVATYPDGTKTTFKKRGDFWTYHENNMTSSASDSYASAVDGAKAMGAKVERVPNPNYRPPKPRLATFERLTGGFGGKR